MIKDKAPLVRVLLGSYNEDDYLLITQLFDEFKNLYYKLDWESNTTTVFEDMKSSKHDVYLIDCHFGEINGLELLREAVLMGCASPIILISAEDNKFLDLEAMKAGAADYLVKGDLEAPLLERSLRYSIQHSRSVTKLYVSEKRFRSVFQSASDAIFLANENGEIILWNKAAEKIYGYEESEILGQSSILLMGNKYAAKAKKFGMKRTIDEVLSSVSGKIIQANGKRKDGTEFPLELSGKVWKTHEETFYTAIVRDITERQKANDSLIASEERYRDLFENANDTIYIHDLTGKFISVNDTGEKMFGYSREEAMELNLSQVVVPQDLEKAKAQIAAKIAGQPSSTYEIDCITKQGNRVSFEVNSRVIFENGIPVAVQGIARDITARKRAEEERDRLYNFSNDLLGTMSFDGILRHINPAWTKILGYTSDELIGKSISDITHPEDLVINKSELKKISKGSDRSFESRLICKDGSYRWILWNITTLVDQQISYLGGRNITERKISEEILERNALFDTLTNLPNRTQFMNHLQKAIESYSVSSDLGFAVLFLDLDRFKIINDGLGHLVGDKLLIAIADRIKNVLRPGDIVARLGGDEFTLLIHNVKVVSDATNVAERIQRHLSKPFKIDNYEVFSSASIGIIIADNTKRTPEDFLRDADSAMYRAKESGKARYEIFDQEMYVRNMNLLKVETDLRKAIDRREFRVFYQPIVCLQTGRIKEFEALIRWLHPQYGLVSPYEFIGIAEETGLIIPIGEWILEEACRQTKRWQDSIPEFRNLSVSVNLSSKQLMHPSLNGQVRNILIQTNLNPKNLRLEVTESTVMENSDVAANVLEDLNSLGISFSTDDFGTGYSSLSYLHQFPFKRIKIDRSFIGKMDTDRKSEAIVRTILMLGQNLGIEVVAEGIENSNQLEKLKKLGCQNGQGYLFSKPVNEISAQKLIKSGIEKDTFAEEIFIRQNIDLTNIIQADFFH